VERGPRAVELAALRAQGLAVPALRVTGYAGPALLVGASVLVGLLSAVLARSIIQAAMPVFTDGWRVLPIDTGAHAAPLLVAAAAALVALAGATLVAARQTIRSASDPGSGDRS
jgi:putative ABC transport system permease protein